MPHELRPLWSGTITFGLVSIPVDLVAAQRHAPGLRMLAPTDHAPIRREYYCPEDGQTLAREDIVRGYALDDRMVPVTDEELEKLAPRSSRDIGLEQFVEERTIDPILFRRAYFLVPSGPGSAKAYHLLAETMERSRRAGIARFVMREVEYLVAILAKNGILRAETLRFADDLRDAADIALAKGKPDGEQVEDLTRALDALARDDLDEDELTDEAGARRRKRASAKRAKGEVIAVGEPGAEPGKVVDIMKLLKERMKAGGKRRAS